MINIDKNLRSSLPKLEYDFEKMGLNQLYFNPEYKIEHHMVDNDDLDKVYKCPLGFTKIPKDRPLIYGSVVTSVDGKIAYSDAPEGPFIASKNKLAKHGATADWWTLNVLRSSADAILFGANTLKSEPEGTGHVYDQNLEDERISRGRNPVPINVIPTIDGLDIPYDHKEFSCGEVPVIIYTTTKGAQTVSKEMKRDTEIIDSCCPRCTVIGTEKIYVLIAETDDGKIDNHAAIKALKKMGINHLLVESPTLLHLLIHEQLVDEIFMNVSGVYIGGDALSIGKTGIEFSSESHPHTQLISLYIHSPSFMYFRYKLIYNL